LGGEWGNLYGATRLGRKEGEDSEKWGQEDLTQEREIKILQWAIKNARNSSDKGNIRVCLRSRTTSSYALGWEISESPNGNINGVMG